MMRAILALMAAVVGLMSIGQASSAEYEIASQTDVVYAEHDGTKLVGDLYLPKGRNKAPVLVAVHGGGWQVGNKAFYRYWGLFFARAGYAVFAIDYRLGKAGTYPAAAYDVKAAIQFVRAKASDFDLDPNRIGLIGDSAGAHLTSLMAVAGDQFNAAYLDDANAAVAADVKAVVGFYGVYDLHAQWTHDLTFRPNDNIVQKFFGASPTQNRRVYSTPPRSATPPSTATASAFCSFTAPTTILSIRRVNQARFSPHLAKPVFLCAGSSFPAPGTSGRPIRLKTSLIATTPWRSRD